MKPKPKPTGTRSLKARGLRALQLYFNETDYDAVKRAADLADRSVAQFWLRAVVNESRRILAEHEIKSRGWPELVDPLQPRSVQG
jgi:uncharacterized protein (DUF1778 family)